MTARALKLPALLLPVLLAACESRPAADAAATTAATQTTAPGASPTSSAPEPDEKVVYSRALVSGLGSALAKELTRGIREGGPVKAIAVCSEKAPAIADTLGARDGWKITRTSLKVRNRGNKPDAWEQAVLERFEKDRAQGIPIAQLEWSETVDGEFRFMKAIETQAMCLTCHGATIADDVTRALDAKYPEDEARGFRVGEIRGAFSVRGR